jgi:magnesium chelatase subunit I
MASVFPFTAIVGQDEMKLALLIASVDPSVGGVLVFGDRGTGKSTAVRALAALLPPMRAVTGCPYGCEPSRVAGLCAACRLPGKTARGRRPAGEPPSALRPVPVVDLPLGATEDRVVGALDLERALADGVKAFEPGLLARANRGFLYIDEANLLEDHLVDLLLDVAASGENVVEREGLSIRHPARFVLVGSGNPEEGELRPQLLDRFGLSVEVKTPTDLPTRIEVIRRRDAFERDPEAFLAAWAREERRLRRRLEAARERLPSVSVPDGILEQAAALCLKAGTDGLRGELTLMRAARALASLDGDAEVTVAHLRRVAAPALRHRLRRNPLEDAGSAGRIERAIAEQLGA